MRDVRWQDHEPCFMEVLCAIRSEQANPCDIPFALKECTKNSPYAKREILGVPSYLIAFLEFLFHKAQGPYSPDFEGIAGSIQTFFLNAPALTTLINHNAPDALANMVLNRRGRLKLLISDQVELGTILEWWTRFGLIPVSQKEVFEAILNKPTIRDRIRQGDPLLILRLMDVFPGYTGIINPKGVAREAIVNAAGTITRPPSERRYHQLYAAYKREGRNIRSLIREEEQRILPMQMRRNRFLAYLVKSLHENTCQICSLRGKKTEGPVEVHHIIPLSQQGKDRADNMLVTCTTHHQAIHAGIITIRVEDGSVKIISADGEWTLSPLAKI